MRKKREEKNKKFGKSAEATMIANRYCCTVSECGGGHLGGIKGGKEKEELG